MDVPGLSLSWMSPGFSRPGIAEDVVRRRALEPEEVTQRIPFRKVATSNLLVRVWLSYSRSRWQLKNADRFVVQDGQQRAIRRQRKLGQLFDLGPLHIQPVGPFV